MAKKRSWKNATNKNSLWWLGILVSTGYNPFSVVLCQLLQVFVLNVYLHLLLINEIIRCCCVELNPKFSHMENERYIIVVKKCFSFHFKLLLCQMKGPSPQMVLWQTTILDRINNHTCLHYLDPQLPVAVPVSVLPQPPLRHSANCLNSQPTDSTTKITGDQVCKISPTHKVLHVP